MKNKVISFLLAIVLVALFLFLALPSAHQQALDSKEKLYKHRLDSSNKAITALQSKDALYLKKVDSVRLMQNKAVKTAIYWQTKYEDIKNTPIVRYSDAGLDSAIVRLYGAK